MKLIPGSYVLKLILAGLACCLPLLVAGALDSMDRPFALLLYKDFSEQLFSGVLYPRWMSSINNGFGAPVMYFYSPLPFYLLALIDALTFLHLPDLRILGLGLSLAFILSCLGAYAWLRQDFGERPAFFGALVYALCPYHFLIDVYSRGTVTELMGYAWLSFTLLAIRLTRTHAGAWVLVAISYAGLIMSAIPTFIFASPLLAFYAIFQGINEKRLARAFAGLLGLAVGLGLTGGYLFTAISMGEMIHQERAWSGTFDVRNWLFCLFSCIDAAQRPAFFFHLMGFMAVAQIFLIAVLWRYLKKCGEHDRNVVFWLAASCVSLFLMMPVSRFAYDLFPFLERIQFPWRMLMVMDFALAFLAAKFVSTRTRSQEIFMLLAAASVFFLSLAQATGFALFKKTLYPPSVVKDMIARGEYFDSYVPKEVTLPYYDILTAPPSPKAVLLSAPDHPVAVERLPVGMKLEMNTTRPDTVKLRQFYFPTWMAAIEETGEALEIRQAQPYGEMLIDYPGGKSTIIIRQQKLPGEILGWKISLLSLLLLLAGTGARGYYLHKKRAG